MFEPSDTPRIFALPIGADFSTNLISGLHERLNAQPPHAIAQVEIFVNTRRTERRLREIFVQAGAGFLPRFHLITDIANDPLGHCVLPPAAPAERRKLQLGQLVRSLLKAEPDLAPISATYDLADSLAALMDEVQGEGIAMSDVMQLDVGEHSAHWNRSKKFLSILAEHWDQHELTDAQDRMRHVVETYSAHWEHSPPKHPILVAGSTGSRGETALFMHAVSRLPNGAVILPGLDTELPPQVWESFAAKSSTLDHPQAGFAKLFEYLGIEHHQVFPWTTAPEVSVERNKLMSLALRPAPITDQWLTQGPALKGTLQQATQNVDLLEAANPKEEALAIATRLRLAAEQGQEAVLISPNRDLTRRVSATLKRWEIEADDSAGSPLQLSPPGIFLRSIAQCFGQPISPHQFLAILKHTLTHSGLDRNEHNLRTQRIEVRVLRGGPPFVEFSQLAQWAEKTPELMGWASWLSSNFQPLERAKEMDLADWIELHKQTAQSLSDGPMADGLGQVWEKDAGQKALAALDTLSNLAHLGGTMTAVEYNALLRSVLSQELRPERQTANPLISIWGTLEARVQSKDLVILGGLNDGIWPAKTAHDMWLNRDMRKQLGLLLPERRIGLSAHDFQQAVAAPNVIMSRAQRDGDAPSTPSRWVIRMTNLISGLGVEGATALNDMRQRGTHWINLARTLDRPTTIIPAEKRPSPIPPADARLKKLSVTQIKDLVRDPYKIYTRAILGLRKLDPLGKQADALERGNAIHAVLEEFVLRTREPNTAITTELFMDVANNVLQEHVPWQGAQRLWLARLNQVADWVVSQEIERQRIGDNIALETGGEMRFDDLDFLLTVKADRIDKGQTGLRLYDYKASKPPSAKEIDKFDKQLQLEAMIAAMSGFDQVNAQPVEHLCYIGLGLERKEQEVEIDAQLIRGIFDEFRQLVATFNDPNKGFTARDKVQLCTHASDFDHLSRKGEWQDSDEPNPQVVP
jgi:double-strand break repair protein AddB